MLVTLNEEGFKKYFNDSSYEVECPKVISLEVIARMIRVLMGATLDKG